MAVKFLENRPRILICLALAVLTVTVYGQVVNHQFVNLDDNVYVYSNAAVRLGISLRGIQWAFTTMHGEFWQPVTWLSHMLDWQLFGDWAGGHHITNLLLHIANTLLLFLIFEIFTGGLWQSAAVAALFALHPLHVESVAWVSERKDVLSSFFFLLALMAYGRYVRSPEWKNYIAVVVVFVLGLMTKPMFVTLPLVLILLDVWPLRRISLTGNGPSSHAWPILKEKIPFLSISLLFGVITIFAQTRADDFSPILGTFPFWVRVANAFLSYVMYLIMMAWPAGLIPFYPHPGTDISLVKAGLSALGILLASAAVCFRLKDRPYLFVGWFWYLITIAPVSGILQIGRHAMADRYTYIPLVGVSLMLAWGLPDLLQRFAWKNKVLAATGGVVIPVLMFVSWSQVGYWKDSFTLFAHTIRVSPGDSLAYNNLGHAMETAGRTDEALELYQQAKHLNPRAGNAMMNLALLYEKNGRTDEAMAVLTDLLAFAPKSEAAHQLMGDIYKKQDRIDDALGSYLESLRRAEDSAIHHRLGQVYVRKGNLQKAIHHYRRALQFQPDLLPARLNLAELLLQSGMLEEAKNQFLQALAYHPDIDAAHFYAGTLYLRENRFIEARRHLEEAARLAPDQPETRNNLGHTFERLGHHAEAIQQYRKAVELDGKAKEPRIGLVRLYWTTGQEDQALRELKELAKVAPSDSRRLETWMQNTAAEGRAR